MNELGILLLFKLVKLVISYLGDVDVEGHLQVVVIELRSYFCCQCVREEVRTWFDCICIYLYDEQGRREKKNFFNL